VVTPEEARTKPISQILSEMNETQIGECLNRLLTTSEKNGSIKDLFLDVIRYQGEHWRGDSQKFLNLLVTHESFFRHKVVSTLGDSLSTDVQMLNTDSPK